ncbi:hypothetical protein V8E36_000264 [Tilletia maclaganii]
MRRSVLVSDSGGQEDNRGCVAEGHDFAHCLPPLDAMARLLRRCVAVLAVSSKHVHKGTSARWETMLTLYIRSLLHTPPPPLSSAAMNLSFLVPALFVLLQVVGVSSQLRPPKDHHDGKHHGGGRHHHHRHHAHHHRHPQPQAKSIVNSVGLPQHAAAAPVGPIPQSSPVSGPAHNAHCEPTGGMATQYWDCCKVAAAWPNKEANVTRPVYSCAKDGVTQLENINVRSGCQGGEAYACNHHAAFVSPTNPAIAYGVGARSSALGIGNFFGACYAIQFKELPGKTLVWQAVNTGDDYHPNQIDIQVPGAGVGYYCACDRQWGSPPDGWGRRYGGVRTRAECSQLPTGLQTACHWRFDWLAPSDHPDGINPTIASMCRVKCPKILTQLTGSSRHDDDGFPDPPQ